MIDKASFLDRFMAPIIVGLVAVGGIMAITMCNSEIIIFIDPLSIGVVLIGSTLVMSLIGRDAPRHEVLDRCWTFPIWIGLGLSLIQLTILLVQWRDAESMFMGLSTILIALIYGVVFGGCILKPLAIHAAWRQETRKEDVIAVGLLPKDMLQTVLFVTFLMIIYMFLMPVFFLFRR